jgi:hypothetical protein
MKLALTFLLCMAMVLMIGGMALASSFNLNQELDLNYFTHSSSGDLMDRTEDEFQLIGDSQINSQMALHFDMIADGVQNEDKSTARFYIDSAYAVYKTRFGTVQVGRYPFNVLENINTMAYLVPELKKTIEVKANYNIGDKLTLLGFLTKEPETSNTAISGYQTADPTYVVGAGWRELLWNADAYFMQYNHIDSGIYKEEDCGALNIHITPFPYGRINIYLAENQTTGTSIATKASATTTHDNLILGFQTDYHPEMPLYFEVDYDFFTNDGQGPANLTGRQHPWGIMLDYRFTPNSTLEFRHSENSAGEVWEHVKLLMTFSGAPVNPETRANPIP